MLKKILIVDDEPNNLNLLRQVLKGKFQLIFANCGLKALSAAKEHKPDLILLDIMMPDLSGYEVCEKLKKNPLTRDIPVIFVTAMSDAEDEAKGFDVGAVDYIQKPISGAIVLRRVQTHLSLVKVNELEKVQKAAVFMLGEAGHYNDNDTGDHIWRMAAYSRLLASAAGWTDEMAGLMELAAPMHDTGKIGIPDEILKAPRELTPEEWVIMKQHTQIGADILNKSDSKLINLASEIALSHHEKWDGSGYPNNLVGEAIPESGRIVAITDVFDALSMKRPYKDAWPIDDVIEEIVKNAGSAFDPRLVDIFQQILPQILEVKQTWDNKN
ncbi:chemotaxis protein CheY [Marinomonas sp. S3726]|uniref:response regulator n=1 Tax=Marinomonas sp. S3726 TaxID=579484 RepID=UPI0005F9BD82|nr:HD domain-containing phosphohydrolase [Marinomonas sp. S3726]KJZ08686.1 chemotaxis protein CheY [Marinomonas sp. S3726]